MSFNRKTRKFPLFILASMLFVLFIFPFVLVLINSFKDRIAIIENPLALSEVIRFSNYLKAFQTMNYMASFVNSLMITIVSVLLIIIFSSMFAYFLVRWNWKMNKLIFTALITSMIVPFQAIMIPFVTIYGNLSLLNNKWALCFFYLGFGISLATFMYHGFIKTIPLELEQAAMLDGASAFQAFWRIVFPILKPVTTTIVILDVLWIWNDFLLPSLVLISEENRTLPLTTFYFFGKYTSNYGSAMAALVLSIFPVLIFYFLMQRQIIQGVMDGSIKQ